MKTGSCCGAPDEANRSIPQGTVGGAMVPVALLLSAPGTVVCIMRRATDHCGAKVQHCAFEACTAGTDLDQAGSSSSTSWDILTLAAWMRAWARSPDTLSRINPNLRSQVFMPSRSRSVMY